MYKIKTLEGFGKVFTPIPTVLGIVLFHFVTLQGRGYHLVGTTISTHDIYHSEHGKYFYCETN